MFTKFLQFVKMSWMFSWRLLIVDAVVFRGGHDTQFIVASVIVAGVLAFGLNKAVTVFPLIRLLMRKPAVVVADVVGAEIAVSGGSREDIVQRKHDEEAGLRKKAEPAAPVSTVSTATADGRMTGFEPSALASIPVPNTSRMTGTPGSNLEKDNGLDANAVKLGVMGEQNFARALAKTHLAWRFDSIWSVPVPDKTRFVPADYDADIDCVIATGSCIYLVDLKHYKSGDVRYYNEGQLLYCEDVQTGALVGDGPKVMSRNMQNATEALRHHFPKTVFKPVVVLMPTEKGEGVIDNVLWPGQIQAMNLTQFLSQLQADSDFDWQMSHAGVYGRIVNLLHMKKKQRNLPGMSSFGQSQI